MAERITKEQAEALIRQTATEAGADDLADILVATAIAETGLDIYQPGDNGHSWGPFHENDGGRGKGLSVAERQNVPNATRRAIAEFREQQRLHPNASPGELAVYAQRPAVGNRPGYVTKVNGIVNDYRQNGDPNRGAAAPRAGIPRAVTVGAGGQTVANNAQTSQGYAFPIRGYKGGEIPAHWGSQDKGARGGADIFAPAGTPVQSMTNGTVQWSNTDDSAGGNNVGILGDDGNTYYYAHLRDPSGLKKGQRVTTGTDIGVVGNTGNAKGTPSHLHIGIGKGIQTGTGALGGLGKEFDATTLLNQALKGGAGYSPTPSSGTPGGAQRVNMTPQEKEAEVARRVEQDADVQKRRKAKEDAEARAAGYQERLDTAKTDYAALVKAYGENGPDAENPPKQLRPGTPQTPGGIYAPWNYETVPGFENDVKKWQTASDTISTLETNVSKGEGKTFQDAKAAAKSAGEEYLDIQRLAGDRIRKELEGDADTKQPRTQIRGNELIDLNTGATIATLTDEQRPPGSTFSVTGKGTFVVNPDGKSASLLPGTETAGNRREIATTDASGKPVTLLVEDTPTGTKVIGSYPRIPSANDRNRTQVIESVDASGNTISQLIDLDNGGRVIATYPKQGPKENIQPVTAPKDAEFISYYDPNRKQIVFERNQNYKPASGSTYRDTKTGRVARFDQDGKLQEVTDVLTADERKTADQLSQAELGKSQADTVKTLIDAAKSLHDQEMERRTQELWQHAQKLMADPNTSRADVIAAIQAGTKSATEWSSVFQTHINQKTQEEVARNNRVKEGVDIQNADRQLREGLYRDLNETRNQRQLAQGRSNEAIAQSGIIGEANSMNALAAMAPQVGMDGITRAGTIGLGVGAGAIDPVKKTYQEHLDELENLRKQMPSVRLANGNVTTPDFSMPRPSAGSAVGTIANKPSPTAGLGTALTDKARGIMLGMSGTPDPASVPIGNGGIPMGGSGVSVATGKSVDQMAEEERKKREAAANGAGGFLPRFRVPQARRVA